MRLTPYIYTYSREAYDTGVPTVRAMVLEFPDDPVTWSKRTQYQFMSGEWLLVAPVYEDTIVRNDIYLPAGKWIDYWDGTEYNGPIGAQRLRGAARQAAAVRQGRRHHPDVPGDAPRPRQAQGPGDDRRLPVRQVELQPVRGRRRDAQYRRARSRGR